MDERPIGMLISGVAGVILLFFLPIMCISLTRENTTQAYINTQVVKFVDNARATGKITDTAYEELCSSIDQVQPFCNIAIEHQEKYVVPGNNDKPETCYFTNTKEEILSKIYTDTGENAEYNMRKGDFLDVTVYNTKPTLATRIYRLIMPMYNKSGVSVYTNYAGYVGNYPEP